MSAPPGVPPEAPHDCPLCPRLVGYRHANRAAHPDWYNAPISSFGDPTARLLIVGLAPGLRGANRTGRPFTGDHAGLLLYRTLIRFGLAEGRYEARPDDSLTLKGCIISNAVRCVPPENKPTGEEIRQCNPFLAARIAALPRLGVILALGRIAHDAVLSALGRRRASAGFAHGAVHDLSPLVLVDSYHCSRYNTQTGRLTDEMFEAAVAEAARRAADWA